MAVIDDFGWPSFDCERIYQHVNLERSRIIPGSVDHTGSITLYEESRFGHTPYAFKFTAESWAEFKAAGDKLYELAPVPQAA